MQPNLLVSIARHAVKAAVICLTITTLFSVSAAIAQKGAKTANPTVTMVIAKRGTITIELFRKSAPKTVDHFLELTNKKFYDGVLFHRLVAGFVAQAGDPASKKVDGKKIADITPEEVGQTYGLGGGGSGKTVPLEAKEAHVRGTLGLARSQDPDSGDAQFFFNLKDNHNLDSGYCCFGKVVGSLSVMDKIHQGDKITSIRAGKASATKKK